MRETGNSGPAWMEIEATRSHGRWIMDISDETAMEIFGRTGTVEVFDQSYQEWLEDMLIEIFKI